MHHSASPPRSEREPWITPWVAFITATVVTTIAAWSLVAAAVLLVVDDGWTGAAMLGIPATLIAWRIDWLAR